MSIQFDYLEKLLYNELNNKYLIDKTLFVNFICLCYYNLINTDIQNQDISIISVLSLGG